MYIFANGNLKKVHSCRVKPFKCAVVSQDKEVTILDNVCDRADVDGEKVDVNDFGTLDTADSNEKKKDTVGTFWMVVGNGECFDEEITTFVVELPPSKHNSPEVIKAKEVELKNLSDYGTFEQVDDIGQERITSRWVITMKEAHDGQKTKFKARLVARGFQENFPPESDSPTVLRESNKLFTAVAANNDFRLVSVDIRAAFLQSK